MSNRPGRKMSRRQQPGGSPAPRSTGWTWRRVLAVACASLLAVLLVAAIAAVSVGNETETGSPVSLAVSLDEYSITGELEAAAGHIVLDVTNDGSSEHNLLLAGTARSRDLAPGEGQRLDLGGLGAGTYELVCDIPSHEQLGMSATLILD